MRRGAACGSSRWMLCSLAGAMFLNSCTATRPVTVAALRADETVTAQSGQHFTFLRSDGLRCDVYRVVGRVASVRGDTLTLRALREVNPRGGGDAACAQLADGSLIVTASGPELAVTREDRDRTSAAIVAVVVVVGLVVLAASAVADAAFFP